MTSFRTYSLELGWVPDVSVEDQELAEALPAQEPRRGHVLLEWKARAEVFLTLTNELDVGYATREAVEEAVGRAGPPWAIWEDRIGDTGAIFGRPKELEEFFRHPVLEMAPRLDPLKYLLSFCSDERKFLREMDRPPNEKELAVVRGEVEGICRLLRRLAKNRLYAVLIRSAF